MKKPLVIFFTYKQLQDASGQIARTFWEHLPAEEFLPTILCADIKTSLHFNSHVVDVKENGVLRFFFRFLRKIRLTDFTLIPDIEYYTWNRRAYRVAKKLLLKGEYDYIHTIATPMSAHLLGLQLKQFSGLPLVVQFNDPWHDNSKRIYKFKKYAERDLKFERQVAVGADLIIHSNQVIAGIWNERYGEIVGKKMHIVPFSFNIYNLPKIEINKRPHSKLVISHVGNIYGTRSAITVFQGIEQLLQEHPNYKDKFILRFIGQVQKKDADFAEGHGLSDYVEYLGMIAPDDLQNIYIEPDVFLVIDMVLKRNGNYPSKLMMYYYYRKPILGLTIGGSNLESELSSSGHYVCYYDNPSSVANYLYKALSDYESLQHFNHDEWKKHTVENVKNIYVKLVENILQQGAINL